MNTSGVEPLDKRVIILPDPAEEKIGTILLPDSVKEQNKWSQTKGTLIAAGENAWSEAVADARQHGTNFTPPPPGTRVMLAKYGGITFKGADGTEYRIMNDEDVTGVLTEGS